MFVFQNGVITTDVHVACAITAYANDNMASGKDHDPIKD